MALCGSSHKYHQVVNLFLVVAGMMQGTVLAQTIEASLLPSWQTQQENRSPEPGQLPPIVQPPGQSSQIPLAPGQDKRVFGVLPNYRTAEMSQEAQPLNPKQKFHIAFKDSFDYPLILLAAGYAGLYQLDDNHPQFGQGAKGYFSRLGTSYSDQVVGNMMTEGLFPVLLHEDPRYFRLAEGSKTKRTLYALSRIFVTRTDAGGTSFNYAEVIGNGVAAGIGLSYYSDNRNVPDFMQNWGIQLATDATSQVLKEYWPDVKRWWRRRHPRK
jgi:hypothetical protein